ncbi:MAG: 4-alpha-glucanotransferase [Candidatus Omnitrophica bacterium]|nr:4-alpha-glucanotransferase [Candidatus Omnitrophota bacterium]MCB9770344.1 4-alpha-glucanotransferase [Candidatus Omnitrophota bacterium]MCB9782325.1 4-alpha-glucanotransferase [Candidatus Omnitrophota bacterium]
MIQIRKSGILLHPTSLPGPYGIGDFGPSAYQFIDFLAEAGQTVWQILPLGPTGYGDSPYQCFSAFAGNPWLISPEKLREYGILEEDDFEGQPDFGDGPVDYGAVISWKRDLLGIAYQNFMESSSKELVSEFEGFRREMVGWLPDYSLFMALKEESGYQGWTEWNPKLVKREPAALEEARSRLADSVRRHEFIQFLFFKQWWKLRHYTNLKGIRIIGDMPIYAAHDSSDVWANREVFRINDEGETEVVAGVPPDYFSETGQLWGNPIYDWNHLRETGYGWWIERIRLALRLCDIVRLDHFLGFDAYWEVPAEEETAMNGRWVQGPAEMFFDTMRWVFGEDLPLIAENLGVVTEKAEALRRKYDLPGMAVFQFGFGEDEESSAFPPHKFEQNLVAYTGTHDNDTILSWWNSLPEDTGPKPYMEKYFYLGVEPFNWFAIRTLMASVADLTVFPLQDILGLGAEGRLNTPGKGQGNWTWRMKDSDLTDELASKLKELTEIYGRAPRVVDLSDSEK